MDPVYKDYLGEMPNYEDAWLEWAELVPAVSTICMIKSESRNAGIPTPHDKIYITFRNTPRPSIKQQHTETLKAPENIRGKLNLQNSVNLWKIDIPGDVLQRNELHRRWEGCEKDEGWVWLPTPNPNV